MNVAVSFVLRFSFKFIDPREERDRDFGSDTLHILAMNHIFDKVAIVIVIIYYLFNGKARNYRNGAKADFSQFRRFDYLTLAGRL